MSADGQVVVNGRTLPLAGLTVDQLLLQLGMSGKHLAVECNQEIVPCSAYGEHRLVAGDRLEIVIAVGGG